MCIVDSWFVGGTDGHRIIFENLQKCIMKLHNAVFFLFFKKIKNSVLKSGPFTRKTQMYGKFMF